MLKPGCIKSTLFSILLRFQESIPIEFELSLLKINQCLLGIDNKNTEGFLPLNKIIEVLQLIMPATKEKVEKIISDMNYQINFNIDINRNIWVLLSRFYFALEKTKKPLKFHLDSMDTKKESISNK